jgi:hypothetical protein
LYIFALRAGKITNFEPKVVIFTARNINIYKICELHRAIFSFILQHLATNLCGFTHSKALFLAVVLGFVLLALIKIQSIAGITHCYGCSSNSPAFTRPNQQLVIGKLS